MTDTFPKAFLVTGSLGWCGQRLVSLLANGFRGTPLAGTPTPERIRCAVLPGQDATALRQLGPSVEVVPVDLQSAADCTKVSAGMDGSVLIHTAGVIHPKRVSEFYAINRDATVRLLAAAAAGGVRRAVVVSSNSPIGCNSSSDHLFDEDAPYNPYMSYGRSKMEMEQRIRQLHEHTGMEVVIVRPPWFYGPGQPSRQTAFFSMIRSGKVPLVGNGLNRRSMVYIDNLAQGLMLAAITTAAAGRTYWIADAKPYAMAEIIDTVERVMERDFGLTVAHRRLRLPNIISDTARLVDGALQACGLYSAKIHVLSEMNQTIACSVDRARQDLGYHPDMSLEEGMRRSIADVLARGIRL